MRRIPEVVAKKCAEILNSLRNGSSLCEEYGKLRGDGMTHYMKAQVMYSLILYSSMPTTLAFRFILDWRTEILRDGLSANVDVPDNDKMRKILSRPSQTKSGLWERQGHRHQTDGLSLLERIYAVHEQMTEK